MTMILLARHGNHAEVGRVLSGRSEIALDARGRAEAAALARWIGARPLAAVHASPRRRTRETAAALGRPVITAPALDEIEFGDFTGRSFAALESDTDWHRWNAERETARCPGGETMGEAAARALDYLWTLPDTGSPVLCVTHCDVIRGIVAQLLGLPFARMFQIGCDPGSVSTVVLAPGDTRIVAINERPQV
ncbi:Broad specificity phosphatase PhoE [Sphingomonas guangdongensis]|uniref:Broad specificity phosphatase PhoE n=1 Tax=Sphingomonas guangdongensis TaxID=1141890 RepID=A0A285QEL5_9SPHN|nr:histidine phosphatase family protein [Sphingomonas guangdongensis]SOB79958.1 Broad specificity phosphatase PhoE [Sphingomonas guangdongensis]